MSISLSNRPRHTLANWSGTRADESTDNKVIATAVPVLLKRLKSSAVAGLVGLLLRALNKIYIILYTMI
ncbi:MAG: hypothetical protein A2W80_14420 [Candidatus Riflebacteria bacterium GWC2_50_8]|nr:MAG: hypothetical protein A2W80_14420 [Candidatus Riflebacteria bacterium GWC2_50_8]